MSGCYSFTGPTSFLDERAAFQRCARVIEALPNGATIRSGGAHGLDTMVFRIAAGTRPDLFRVLVAPAAPFNSEVCLRLAHQVLVPPEAELLEENQARQYRMRNERLVDGSDELKAFLKQATFYRSGEWMTVNIALRTNVPVEYHVGP